MLAVKLRARQDKNKHHLYLCSAQDSRQVAFLKPVGLHPAVASHSGITGYCCVQFISILVRVQLCGRRDFYWEVPSATGLPQVARPAAALAPAGLRFHCQAQWTAQKLLMWFQNVREREREVVHKHTYTCA